MADEGFDLIHVSASQAAHGQTVGLWLFFADLTETVPVVDTPLGAAQPIRPALTAMRQPVFATEQGPHPESPVYWLQEIRAKKGLGLSLTLTGMTSVIIGVILHFALQHNLIETTFRLGYFFGVVGLLLFLIGLLIVF
jgi:hypothetical protein